VTDIDHEKLFSLCEIMSKVHALAERGWPTDEGAAVPNDVTHLIMDIQEAASRSACRRIYR
jgi:hypothetical protein